MQFPHKAQKLANPPLFFRECHFFSLPDALLQLQAQTQKNAPILNSKWERSSLLNNSILPS